MKRYILCYVAAFVVAASFGAQPTRRNEAPNLLFIFSDDQSYEALGAMGNEQIETPHLDRLAESGVLFRRAYNMGAWRGAVCVASRAMLFTGRALWDSRDVGRREFDSLAEAGKLWPQRLKDAGYETYMTGKWHPVHELIDGKWEPVWDGPERIFDHVTRVRPGMPRGSPEAVPEMYGRPVQGQIDAWSPYAQQFGGHWEGGAHWSEILAEDAEAFLERSARREAPFFMFLSFNAPHDPRQAPKRFVDKYSPVESIELPSNYAPEYPLAEEIGAGPELRDEKLAPFPRTEYAVKKHRQEYYAIISHLDEQVGRILDSLEKTGQAANTVIIFTSDHGLAVGNHGLMGKQNMYEHSVRVPLIIAGPGIPNGETRDQAVYLQDAMPTTLELAGLEVGPDIYFRSLMPLIENPEAPSAYSSIYGAYMEDRQRMILRGDYKLVLYPKAGALRLFNIKDDPAERINLANNPSYWPKAREMLDSFIELRKSVGDPLAVEEYFPQMQE